MPGCRGSGAQAHIEMAVWRNLHGQGDLFALGDHDSLVDLHIAELHGEVRGLLPRCSSGRLPGGAHIGGGWHQDAAIDDVIREEVVLATWGHRPGPLKLNRWTSRLCWGKTPSTAGVSRDFRVLGGRTQACIILPCDGVLYAGKRWQKWTAPESKVPTVIGCRSDARCWHELMRRQQGNACALVSKTFSNMALPGADLKSGSLCVVVWFHDTSASLTSRGSSAAQRPALSKGNKCGAAGGFFAASQGLT